MLKALLCACAVAWCIVPASVPAAAQEVIHALTGTVTSINNAAKTITVFQDNGSRGVFKELSDSNTRIAFDKRLAAETTAASAFSKQGAYAIIFYFGIDENRTIVALKPLGTGSLLSTRGTVTKIDDHSHSLSVTDDAGTVRTFKVDAQTVEEGNFGAVSGLKLGARKGDRVRVVSSTVDGNSIALFVRGL